MNQEFTNYQYLALSELDLSQPPEVIEWQHIAAMSGPATGKHMRRNTSDAVQHIQYVQQDTVLAVDAAVDERREEQQPIFNGSYLLEDGKTKVFSYIDPVSGRAYQEVNKQADYNYEEPIWKHESAASKQSLRDKLFLDVLHFPEGDSPKEVVLTRLVEAGRKFSAYGNAQNRGKLAGALLVASSLFGPSYVTESIQPKQETIAENVTALPMTHANISFQIKEGQSISDLAGSLRLPESKLTELVKNTDNSTNTAGADTDLSLSLPVSKLKLGSAVSITDIATRFQLPIDVVLSANNTEDEIERRDAFTIPARAVLLTDNENPNIDALAHSLDIDSNAIRMLNPIADGMIAVPVDKVLNDEEVALATIAIDAPESKELQVNPENMTDSEYIAWLAEKVVVTPEDYEKLHIDKSRLGVFDDELAATQITPKRFVGHWTAGLYPNGVDQFVSAIKNREGNCCSVMFYIDKESKIYRFVANPKQLTAHALNNNDDTQGVEIEARNLRDYTPDQLKQFIVLAYGFMTNNDIPIERQNFVGHEEIDAEKRGAKHDMPKELVDALFPKLKKLSEDLSSQEDTVATLHKEFEGLKPQEKFDKGISMLLDDISSHEGGWDSVNTGKPADTPIDGAKYNALFSGRKLSQLTIAEVLDLQQNHGLFAVGRYQFIPPTLRSAVKSTKIDVNQIFDENTQTKLAVDYLIMTKRQNLAGYITGKNIPVELAVNDLCKEWASMPCTDGTGYYDGDSAGNKGVGGQARVKLEKALLNEIRQSYIDIHAPVTTTSTSAPTTTIKVENPLLMLTNSPVDGIEPTWMSIANAEPILSLYFPSNEDCKAWLAKQEQRSVDNGATQQVLIDINKLP